MRDEEETTVFRQRTGRLQKWRDLAEEAAREKSMNTVLPDGLQNLVLFYTLFFWSFYSNFH